MRARWEPFDWTGISKRGQGSMETAPLAGAVEVLYGEVKQKGLSVTPRSWTCHDQGPWVGSFVLFTQHSETPDIPLRNPSLDFDHEFSGQHWILKTICCDLFPKCWLQGSRTASFFLSSSFFCASYFIGHSCHEEPVIPSLSIKMTPCISRPPSRYNHNIFL